MKPKEKSCRSNAQGFSSQSNKMGKPEESATLLTRSALPGLSGSRKRRRRTRGLAPQWVCVLFRSGSKTGQRMNRMANRESPDSSIP